MSTKKQQSASADLAEQVAEKIAEQHRKLTLDEWQTIKDTMDADEGNEIKLTFTTTLTNRPAEEGTVASKDSRIVSVVAFSLGKHTAKMESPFPDAAQMELGDNK